MVRAERLGDAPGLAAATACLQSSYNAGHIPSAVLELGTSRGVLSRAALGAPEDAIYDLASLTKVLATGLVAMHLVGERRLDLEMPVRDVCPAWHAADRQRVTVRDLLSHCSGLPAHLPLFATARRPVEVIEGSAQAALVVPPRTASVYSDLGFIVLGDVLARVADASLCDTATRLLQNLSEDPPRYQAPERRVIMPTGVSAWRGRALLGEVHDDNAAALGGAAGHAGLFGSARGVGDVARALLDALRHGRALPVAPAWAVSAFARRSTVPGSSRALAWDTALPTSSSGPHLSRQALGHTGFTGTSLWIDPELDLYVVLLTNRVAGTATVDDMRQLRRAVHTAVGSAWREVVG